MRRLISDIGYLWHSSSLFKAALSYLALLLLIIALLPLLPLPFGPNDLHLNKVFVKPFTDTRHLLGTDQLGRDVLVNCLYGARNGLLIALPVMVIASVVGTAVGSFASYFGNHTYTTKTWKLLWLLLAAVGFCYYAVYVPLQVMSLGLPAQHIAFSVAVGLGLVVVIWFVFRSASTRTILLQQSVRVPLDALLLRVIELLTSIPRLLILIAVAAFSPPSVLLLSAVFAATYWTGTARLARAEMLRIRQLPYLEAAISAGLPTHRIVLKEAIPNLLTPVIVAFVFGVAALLAVESTLSFLGIGLPADFPSWGRTISGIRSNLSAWWLVAFPGGFLAITVLALQACSYQLVRLNQK